ncbi:MAG: RagB/SusD family nutrient uptake outer membrane protein [Prevotellaceae bacterium]|jgi:hypothetical protein|nr:RagB/SusD family nutrient uptake outer membrane protein [Prevotellaceae bacterium]
MKKFILLSISCLLFAGCEDFLDTESLTKKDSSNFPKTPTDADKLLTGTYAKLTDTYPLQLLYYASEIMSDNCLGGGGISDTDCKNLNTFTTGGRINRLRNTWKHNYSGVFRANLLITNADRIDWGEKENELKEKNRIMGEAHFLRAYYYFDLVRWFENIPLVLTTEPINPPQVHPDEVYARIASDLKLAIESLSSDPFVPADPVNSGRVTKWAAQGFMAKVFLFYTGFYQQESLPLVDGGSISKQQVIDWLDDCIQNSGHDLVDDFRRLWPYSYRSENTSHTVYNYVKKNNIGNWVGDGNIESVFAVKYSSKANLGDWGEINRRSNQVCLYYGMRISSKVGENYYEATFPWGQGWGQATVNSKLWEDWPDADLRKKGSLLNVMDPEEDIWMDKSMPPAFVFGADGQTEETDFWNKKHMPVNSGNRNLLVKNYNIDLNGAESHYQWNNIQDLVIMRFADILLMAAELGGPNAKTYLNKVRQRAGYIDEIEPTLENIMDERRFELAFEGVRYYDLMRWHRMDLITTNQTNIAVRNQGQAGGVVSVTFRPETRGFMAIPESEIELSGYLLQQNDGWD